MDNVIEQVADLIEAQVALNLDERQAETLRAAAFLAVTEIDGVTSGIFADAAVRVLGGARQGYQNRFNESRAVWGDEFKFQGDVK
jgi:hypothetical protein